MGGSQAVREKLTNSAAAADFKTLGFNMNFSSASFSYTKARAG
jgi:hypothetical protein